jgi:putative nucleotidyltransferase with HDIG domain
VVIQTALVRAGVFIATVLSARSETTRFSDAFGFQFAIPFAASALVLSLLVGSQIALVSAMIVAVFVGLISTGGIAMSLFALSSSIIAIYSVERYRTRNAITRAILVIGGVNIFMSAAVTLIANRDLTWRLAAKGAVWGLLGALLTAAVASLATPIYESAFNILTDMRLLELSNADLPLLRELAIRTPGTNHHSFVVGTLAETAAKAVGANPLLARIGCLYHDIGKLAAPKMYIENQQGGPNPHDRVEPRDSVRIITGHVRRGLKMAHEAGLPPQIIDFIPQHHGTRVLSYFYHKAKAQAEARGETVNIDDFRYPGPKPQTKEAVILMLSDAAEAAVRSLEEPTPENIRSILKKIVDSIVADGQLDECNVTLQEITAIRESLINTLIGIYHQRIGYPGFNPPSEVETRGPNREPDGTTPREGDQHRPPPEDQKILPQHVRAQSPR